VIVSLRNTPLIVLIVIILASCFSPSEAKKSDCDSDLKLLATYELEIREPSGLTLFDEGLLMCISDEDKEAYVISTEGVIQSEIKKKGGDTEGVAYDSTTKTIYSADENDGLLRSYTITSQESRSWPVIEGSKTGLEGIALDPKSERVFLLKEDEGLIHFYPSTGKTELFPLEFAQDYSGLFFVEATKELWILSDQSSTLSRCTVKGEVMNSYTHCVVQAEGVAVDVGNGRIYLVSDSEEELYVFELN